MSDLIRRYLLEGYATTELTVGNILICIGSTAILAMYIYVVYKRMNKNSFYNRNFNLSLIALAIITAAIILTIQSNIVVSLGMVGALSIVRFRTAIKDPLDLIFMFWSISIGIICGAGYILIAVIASLVITLIMLWFTNLPLAGGTMILVVNADSFEAEDELAVLLEKFCKVWKTRARNLTKGNINLAIEIETSREKELLKEVIQMEHILSASVVENSGDVTV
ncbi:MAG: DUF4956 domain-containing protein [Lachnospiraceae bacterium]|nr:DUF4956 domain-containing protein [Lachnospiraceae bacterium]